MSLKELIHSSVLLYFLLNPFLMSIYLLDLLETMSLKLFIKVLARGSAISSIVFIVFAYGGENIFRSIGARFAAFLLFGGIVFLLIAIRFVFYGSDAIKSLRGKPEHIEGSIALPFMIGPGTVSVSVLLGNQLTFKWSVVSIFISMTMVVISLIILKYLFDLVKHKYSEIVEKYVDIVGRISALYIGTISIEMIIRSFELIK